MFTLLLAACNSGMIDTTDPTGHDIDNPGTDTHETDPGTDVAYISARNQECSWNGSTVTLGNLDEPNGASYVLTGPTELSGSTVDQPEIQIGEYHVVYTYEIAGFTFTGQVGGNLADTTDLSADLNTPSGLDGLALHCEFNSEYGDYNEFDTSFIVDGQTVSADRVGTFNVLGATFSHIDSGSALGCLSESEFAYNASNANYGDFTIECAF